MLFVQYEKEDDVEILNDMPVNSAEEAKDTRSRLQRLVDGLFPMNLCPTPGPPTEWKSLITVRTVTKLKFWDWIRVLITGVVCVDVKVTTENEVGNTRTEAVCFIGTYRDVRGDR